MIGTGSSGIQSIPIIAEQAQQLYVFQRTPNYSVPAGNRALTDEELRRDQGGLRRTAPGVVPQRRRVTVRRYDDADLEVPPEERRAAFEKRWQLGGVLFSKTFPDQMTDLEANDEAKKFWEAKIRAVIDDPRVAELLIPDDHPIGAKRICTDSNYFQTFNSPHVSADQRAQRHRSASIDATGIDTTEAHFDVDAIVFATGFDALTGSLGRIDIVGRGGERLRDDWADGPRTYLGLADDGFPEPVHDHRPGQPGGAGQHGPRGRGARRLDRRLPSRYLDENGYAAIEATPDAVDDWLAECAQRAETTLFTKANSWYLGANIPGKPRVFMLFCGGFGVYNEICAEVAAAGYKGFELIRRANRAAGSSARWPRRPASARSSPSARSSGTHAIRRWGWCASGSATCPAG